MSLRGSIRRAPDIVSVDDALRKFLGGLKGKMAPGDAHPYLALFYLENFYYNIIIARIN